MDSSEDSLIEEARRLIQAAKQSLETGGTARIIDPLTVAQGYLHLLIREPKTSYEMKLREAIATLRAALTKTTSA